VWHDDVHLESEKCDEIILLVYTPTLYILALLYGVLALSLALHITFVVIVVLQRHIAQKVRFCPLSRGMVNETRREGLPFHNGGGHSLAPFFEKNSSPPDL
jgi:hypothetical protein